MSNHHSAWLNAHQFEFYGSWSPDDRKLRRCPLGRNVPGVYAFVVDGTIQYLGKAGHMRGRIRAYRRAFQPVSTRPFRGAHKGIRASLKNGRAVHVLIFRTSDADEALKREAEWIYELKPCWNGKSGHPSF
jgi:excinuclease UvrABC nuclease subunit